MSSILSTSNQIKWKDCYASSAQVGLTLRCNGEEPTLVYTPERALVQAGFDAPIVAPVISNAGAGLLPAGYYCYAYVYASSKYPNVEAIIAAGGYLYPKSNPSPASAAFSTAANRQNNVTVQKSDRSDVDFIFVYRTAVKSTAAEATALATAGEMFYVGRIADDSIPGTAVFVDNNPSSTEQMELDNYTASTFWLCWYESPFWWGGGNPQLDVAVTLAGGTAITATADTFYAGRKGQTVTFDGITSGGFDGLGTYYFKYLSDSVANVSLTADAATATTVPATGTTTMHVKGYAGTLYRSKPNNPFAWGITEYQTSPDGSSIIRIPQEYALPIGGRIASLSVIPQQRLLKVDVENPSSSYTLNLALGGADQNSFANTKRTIDRQFVCSSHFAQFVANFPSGQTQLVGIDSSSQSLIRCDAVSQASFGDEVFRTMRSMVTTDDLPRKYHGLYDPTTELNCWWIKTAEDSEELIDIDTCICFHGPSGQWSKLRDFDITASASVFDPVELETIIITGDSSGNICRAFDPSKYDNSMPTPASPFEVSSLCGDIAPDQQPTVVGDYVRLAPTTTPSGGANAGTWCLMVDANGGSERWMRLHHIDGFVVAYFDLVYFPAINAVVPASAVGFGSIVFSRIYFGLIDCEIRTYFQPSQTSPNQSRELWSSFKDPIPADELSPVASDKLYRFYQEFDEDALGIATPIQDTRPDGTPSVNWIARTIPNPLVNQMGYRFIQRGFEAFEVLGLNIKNAQA